MRARSLVCLCVLAAGCEGASPNAGIGALFRLSGGQNLATPQYVAGELGTETRAAMPTMQAITIANISVFPGATGRGLSGSANAATAVLIGLEGDAAHWLVPTTIPDAENPGAFIFQTSFALAPQTPLDPPNRSLVFRAVDAQGDVGPAMALGLKISALASSATPPILQVTLTWDTEADLDLKVRVPFANPGPKQKPYLDVWTKSPVALPPVAQGDPAYTPADIAAAGQLDFDSNAQCVIDGRLHENVSFTQPPPSGTYDVHVDATSMCGQVAAQWHAVATLNGAMIGQAYGQVGDIDTQGSHGPATGTLAFTFMVP